MYVALWLVSSLLLNLISSAARFMPNHQLASGHLHLSYPSHPPADNHVPLSLFRTSDFPLAVVGIASCAPNDSLATILAQFQTTIHETFPHGSMFPLASNCFVFEESDSTTNIDLGDDLEGLVVIPGIMGNKGTYIGTLIADLCSKVLVELATVVRTLPRPYGRDLNFVGRCKFLRVLSETSISTAPSSPHFHRLRRCRGPWMTNRDAIPYLPFPLTIASLI